MVTSGLLITLFFPGCIFIAANRALVVLKGKGIVVFIIDETKTIYAEKDAGALINKTPDGITR
jgi:hypothetical protein